MQANHTILQIHNRPPFAQFSPWMQRNLAEIPADTKIMTDCLSRLRSIVISSRKKKNPVSDSVIKTTSDMCEIPSTVQANIRIQGRTQKDGYRNGYCTSIEAKQLFLEFTFHCLDTEQK